MQKPNLVLCRVEFQALALGTIGGEGEARAAAPPRMLLSL
jgi:hypothetical protein